jgi:hypothetical protein
MILIPRTLLFGVLAAVVALAILTATVEAALIYRAIGPIIAAALGLVLLPFLIRGASSGAMRTRTAWIITLIGCIICLTATVGLEPERLDCVSISWYTCGLLAGSVMVWMAGHRLPPLVAVTVLLLQVTAWAGPVGTVRLGLAAEVVIVVAGLAMHRAMRSVTRAAEAAAVRKQELTQRQSEQDAFRDERQRRLRRAGRSTAPMLQHIIDARGELDDAARAACRLLEQTLRDEIRGRHLLNDAVRAAVLAQRRRGASVQVLDDGGLDDLSASALDPLLADLARRLEPVRSSRIVIRTGHAESATAITIVASTPDETAVALGLDDGDRVELWATIPRSTAAPLPV